ncbi:putative RNA-binding protein sce3 [Hypsizygus marmoreus]|uniref:RNA-binding protein sce3 n=1 Tax=Hypsizygus marmoreus TaxID=39966 RepID=A0A369K6V9_HYPMA|nr:putative RNA-binding protein sce3 [Hypsizygus marmoreus]
MPPKKAKKISLNEFLGDSALGSWADEMDSLPNAPAARSEDDQGRPGDRYGRRDDFLSSRPDRVSGPPRDDIPLPTQPPYTAFIGNLAFDLTESELEEFFTPSKTKSVKIIRDREDKPKGFGYIEFEELDGLKDALAKSNSNFSGRTIRVSVAEPPKERGGFGGGFEDDSKFDSPWRRDGPLPDIGHSRDSSRRRFDGPPSGERALPSVTEGLSDWRSSRLSRPSIPDAEPPLRRRGSGFSTPEGQPSAADQADVWTKGSKFVPSAPSSTHEEKFGSLRGRGDMGPPRDLSVAEEGDWRAKPKSTHGGTSPTSSTPPTPQLSRKKLELLPRSGSASATPSPLSSPKMGPSPPVAPASHSRASPFGAARPVDVTTKEKEVTERIEKEREVVKDRLTMSRTSSRTASERSPLSGSRTPPATSPVPHTSPKPANATMVPKPASLAPTVRPTLSFASAAKKDSAATAALEKTEKDDEVEKIAEKVAEVAV